MIATLLLALLSTVVGVSNKWNLKLPKRPQGHAPPGDVVIRYPNGSYLIVRCDEDVARELYFAPEEIEYTIKNPLTYQMLSLAGTLMLMLGVIALANAKIQLQFIWAGSYIIINVAHWVAAALPQKMHWDLSCYEVREEGVQGGPSNGNFTEALWKAILLTKSTQWVKSGDAAPKTPVWDDWLVDAEYQAKLHDFQIGELIKPIWKEGNVKKARVWEAPDKEVWDAKTEWNKLNQAHKVSTTHIMPQKTEDSCVSSSQEAQEKKTEPAVTIT